MKSNLSLLLMSTIGAPASAFVLPDSTSSSPNIVVNMGNGGMDAYDAYMRQMQGGGGAAPAPAPAPAAPAPAAGPPSWGAPPATAPASPPAAPAVEEEEDTAVPTSFDYGKVDYDPSKDVFPTFPPDYPTFEEIWAKFQAKEASGAFDRISSD